MTWNSRVIVPSGNIEPYCGGCDKALTEFEEHTLYPIQDWGKWAMAPIKYALLCDNCSMAFWEAEIKAMDDEAKAQY
jgi:hypothetical protein